MMRTLLAAGLLLLTAGPARAADPVRPAPPAIDLSILPRGADVQPREPDGEKHPVRACLLAESDQVAAGSTARVGLLLRQEEDWHTYWKSPGDIGLPTEITWTLPPGATITPHAYPVPERYEQDGMVSYGYSDEVLLISELTVPADLAPGTYRIAAEATWLVCKTACIPGNAHLERTIEVVAPGTPVEPGPHVLAFDHYEAAQPTPLADVEGLAVDVALSQSALRPNEPFSAVFLIRATGDAPLAPLGEGTWPTFAPIVGGADFMLNEVAVRKVPEGLAVHVKGETFEPDPLPTGDHLGGLVQVRLGDAVVRTEVVTPLAWVPAGTDVVDRTDDPLFRLAGIDAAAPGGEAPPPPDGAADTEASARTLAAGAGSLGPVSLAMNLALAFAGGLLLNVMPCVLPVITLKLYGLVEQSDVTPGEQRKAGLAYTGGILASFWALAAAVVVLRTVFGIEVDWGFQFQYPPYVAALATVVFAFGLSLFGVFEIPAFGATGASAAASREGIAGYFFTGVFATLLATPCSAPFLGTAIAYAFGAPTPVLVGIFTFVALGLAAPFLFIAFVPAAYRLLPQPGAWMEAFKQLLGFTLIATTVWLLDVLVAQIGADRAVGFVGFLVFVGMGCWIFGRWGGVAATARQQALAGLAGVGVASLGGWALLDLQVAEAAVECDTGEVVTELDFAERIPWQPFNEARVAALAGKPVFIDFTADWCLTCKVNERTILESQPVRRAMAEHGVVPLKADWTRRDPTITEWLRRYGRAGVPFYLILPADPNAEPIALPEVITGEMVIRALASAS